MVGARFALVAAAVAAFAVGPAGGQSAVVRSAYHDFRVVTVVDGLEHPWSMAFLLDGDMLVTEQPGRLRVIHNGRLLADPVPGVPEVLVEPRGRRLATEGGLLDIALHPNFAANRLIYLSFSKPNADRSQATTAVVRARFENHRLTAVEEVFEAVTEGRGSYGSRLAFDGDGFLFITIGDRQTRPRGDMAAHPAQDLSNHQGTTVRLHDDGRVPIDNPFVGRDNARPEIFSYGHRNAQGLAVHPQTEDIWLNEHGPQGGDELNLILPGRNYGWPVIGFGVNYTSGLAIHAGTHQDGMEQPVHLWVPSIAASGLLIYDGDRFPGWRGSLFVGGLQGEQLARLTLNERRVVLEETLLHSMGRIRDIRQGPEGYIYLAIDGLPVDGKTTPTPILRLQPANGN
ncbi:MAG TPA: PQQ-dependent sugar dehydrogenase [Acidobacteriota bacterium]|nr:PQQ-dependent sugar dehydrogenase [Acidobacteriota bacterium]